MAKPKPIIEETCEGMKVTIASTLSTHYLIVDGVVRDTFKGIMTSSSLKLSCVIDGTVIEAEFKMQVCGITVFLTCNGVLIAKKWQL